MKLTHTQNMKARSGMTLLELTVVILVLLSLISILFIGARAWKRGSDRAAAILQIRNVQQAVRAHSNMVGLAPLETSTTLRADVIGPDRYIENDPVGNHPAPDHDFEIGSPTLIPDIGDLYMISTGTDAAYYTPAAADVTDW